MKKWLIPISAAACVLAGCGGGGGSSSTIAGVGNGDSIATANIPNTPGQIGVQILSGQGRAQGNIGDLEGAVSTPKVLDSSGKAELPNLGQTINIDLTGGNNGGTQNLQYLNIADIPNGNSHQFNTYELIVDSLGTIADSAGNIGWQAGIAAGSSSYALDAQFNAQIGAFPGRQTTVQLFLNDGQISVNGNAGAIDRNQFLLANTTTDNPNVQGFFSDFVQFDLSHVTNLPTLSDGTTVGSKAYFNGDKIGLSGATVGSLFQVYTPSVTLTGTWANPTSITNFGTYALKEISPTQVPIPTDPSLAITITSLQGTWKPATTAFNNLGTFEVLLFPHNVDDNQQDIVVFTANSSGQITSFYFGLVDLSAKTFAVFPIADVIDGSTSGEVDGTLTSLLDGSGNAVTAPASVRQGRYSFTGTLPTGFKATGRFVVYRR